jgi:hypothetical protein
MPNKFLLTVCTVVALAGASLVALVSTNNSEDYNAQTAKLLSNDEKITILKEYTARTPAIFKSGKITWEKELNTLYSQAKAKGFTFDPALVRFSSSTINNDYHCTFSNMTWNQIYNCILKRYGPNNDINVEQLLISDPNLTFDNKLQTELDDINKKISSNNFAPLANEVQNLAPTLAQLRARKAALERQKAAAALRAETQRLQEIMRQISAVTKAIAQAQANAAKK